MGTKASQLEPRLAAGREPSGFPAFVRLSPDGLRRSAKRLS